MDLWQLKVFCKVIELKSFSKAGSAVYLSQPTVSSHIKDLETGVGCKLIDRLPKDTRLAVTVGVAQHLAPEQRLAVGIGAAMVSGAMRRRVPTPFAHVKSADKRHGVIDHHDLLVLGCADGVMAGFGVEGYALAMRRMGRIMT